MGPSHSTINICQLPGGGAVLFRFGGGGQRLYRSHAARCVIILFLLPDFVFVLSGEAADFIPGIEKGNNTDRGNGETQDVDSGRIC